MKNETGRHLERKIVLQVPQSPLLSLPTEVLQQINLECMETNSPMCSPILGAILSNVSMYKAKSYEHFGIACLLEF